MINRFLSIPLVCAGLSALSSPVSAQGESPQPKTKAPAISAQPAAPEEPDVKTVSYLIGRQIGESFKRQSVDVELDQVVRGIKSALEGGESEFSKEESDKIMSAFQAILSKRMMLKRKLEAFKVDEKGWEEMAAKNKAEGEKHLADNAKKEGVKTTASGLQYEILEPGTGDIPKLSDTVNAIYKGTLLDGTVFDDSKGAPRPFGVSRVVKGWTEALQMMPVGSKWRLTIPGDLAYGPEGNRPPIGPNATLVFEMELASIKKAVQAVTPPVGITIPPRDGASTTKPKKRITATTPPVSVPIPKKKEAAPEPDKKAE